VRVLAVDIWAEAPFVLFALASIGAWRPLARIRRKGFNGWHRYRPEANESRPEIHRRLRADLDAVEAGGGSGAGIGNGYGAAVTAEAEPGEP